MKNFFKIILVVISILITLLIFHALNYYFPTNILTKIVRGFTVVITPVLIALVIMYLINPLAQYFINRRNMNKKLSIGLSMGIFIAIILGLVGFSAVFMVSQGREFYAQISDPNFLAKIEAWFSSNGLLKVYNFIIDFIKAFDFSKLFQSAGSIVSNVLQILASVILAPIFLWHFMNSQDVVLDRINDNIPETWRTNVIPILKKSNNVIVTYFKSKLVSICILFVLFFVLYIILGLPIGYVLLFAFLISFLDLIPYLGPTLGSIIPVLYIFSVGGTDILYINNWHVNAIIANIIMLAINVLFQYIQGNVIVPALIGKDMEINSALILVFMLFFGYVLGFWGIILSIPLGGICLVIWDHFKQQGLLKDNSIENKTVKKKK